MKHTGSYIIAAIWILIAVLLCGVLVKGLRGSDSQWNILNIGSMFRGLDVIPGDTEIIETSYSADSIKNVDVELVSSSFNMTQASVDEVQVKIITNLPEEKRPVAKLNGSTLEIHTPKHMGNNNWLNNYRTRVEVYVPASFNSSSYAASREIDIDGVSGSIYIEQIKAADIDIDVVSGSVVLSDIEAKTVDCDAVSGSVNINGKLDGVDVQTVSGSINVKTSTVPTSKCAFEAVSGSVRFTLPENDGFTLDYSSVSGTTSNDFTGFVSDRKSKSGKNTYKDGELKITAGTISGSITIKKD
ncbi:MAG: DUF4097 domain-containing protein [Treponemataceae bacterium]|nr:DUF4097 domain-containing protein [Treponemataceae bacterium]